MHMKKPQRILITGGRGLLGTPTAIRFASEGCEVFALPHTEFDVTDLQQVVGVIATLRTELVIHCAAFTKVDECESRFEYAMGVNADGAENIARATFLRGIRMVHISTDYVFDGTARTPYAEDDQTGPAERLSAYGRSKLAGELAVQSANSDALIVRTSWLYGPDGPGFPQAILRQARAGHPLRVVNDQTGSPTYAPDLADAIFQLASADAKGIVHFVNSGACTWYDFACEIIRLSGLNVPITRVSTAEFPRPARRPAWSVLSTKKYSELTGHTPRPWGEAVGDFLRTPMH